MEISSKFPNLVTMTNILTMSIQNFLFWKFLDFLKFSFQLGIVLGVATVFPWAVQPNKVTKIFLNKSISKKGNPFPSKLFKKVYYPKGNFLKRKRQKE